MAKSKPRKTVKPKTKPVKAKPKTAPKKKAAAAAKPVKPGRKAASVKASPKAPAAPPKPKKKFPIPPPLKGVAQPLVPIILDEAVAPPHSEAPTKETQVREKSRLRPAQLDELRQLLQKRRGELLVEIREELSQSVKDAKTRSADPTDQASDSADGDLALALAQSGSDELAQIDAALVKVDSGDLGVCEECGCCIPMERLRALPHATTCIECKRKQELQRGAEGMEDAWEAVSESEEEQGPEEE
jgi:DnaK suppressor protein